ncbi:TetR family transcriptional regulator [Streptomyces sp. NPDC007264]|uniref:TetR family transcriptional regulator n=1 Tax=Streptomyces sp. NPDC007264 TaxID=3364777 RepID=UPI0036DCFBBC
MAVAVARNGLAGTTIADVAAAAGLQRTLVLHYFRDRDELVTAFIDEAVASYGERMLGEEDGDIDEQVERLFEPGAYQRQEDLVIWTELVALAARDADVRRRLHQVWTGQWLPHAELRLRAAHPTASPEQVAATAYALACLVEAHWAFQMQGVTDPTRRRQAQAAARTLLARLGPVTEQR